MDLLDASEPDSLTLYNKKSILKADLYFKMCRVFVETKRSASELAGILSNEVNKVRNLT